ncbi:MAG TPA: hypothetical protein DCY74_05045, partial [Clostridiales bacterium]|nr:hypothetical protein [Clostridiales bacterium]
MKKEYSGFELNAEKHVSRWEGMIIFEEDEQTIESLDREEEEEEDFWNILDEEEQEDDDDDYD